MRKLFRSAAFYVVLALVVLAVASTLLSGGGEREKLSLSRLQALVAEGQVKSATVVGTDKITGELQGGQKFEAKFPAEYADELTKQMLDANPKVDVDSKEEKENVLLSLLFSILPIALLFVGFIYILNSMQGGGNRVMQFGKAKAKVVNKDQPQVTFDDVAGADEAVAELQEIKEFLESPAKFQAIGAKIPKGVLLYGPPGTGKTELAKVCAAAAGLELY